MPKYKVTKVYEVEAQNKQEAIDKVIADPDSLMYVSCSLVYTKNWTDQAKEQLFGSQKK